MSGFTQEYIKEAVESLNAIDADSIDAVVNVLAAARERGGRIFFVGVGGSAANASHAVNDFRKIAQIECYAPTDNVAELTARTNDDGWDGVFVEWLRVSRLSAQDVVFVLSVSGGNIEKKMSLNIVAALQFAQKAGSTIVGIVGDADGYTAQVAQACVVIPSSNANHVTPHSEGFQAVVWHLMVSHPLLKRNQTKWESTR